jgi:hypothetical protein
LYNNLKEIEMTVGANRGNRRKPSQIDAKNVITRQGDQGVDAGGNISKASLALGAVKQGGKQIIDTYAGAGRSLAGALGGGGKVDLGGRSTLGREDATPDRREIFRESAKGLTPDDPTLSNVQVLARRKKADVVKAVGVKPVIDGTKTKATGTKRPSNVTDYGDFARTAKGPTLREEANAPGLFKTTRETIAANFKANKLSAQRRGAAADAKAVNAKRKSLGDLYASVAETDPSSPMLAKIQEELNTLFTPKKSENAETAELLAIDPNMTRGTLRKIIASRRGN